MTQAVLFKHVHNKSRRLRYTIAYNFTKTGNKLSITYGIAQCHNKHDTFTREEGRSVAADRLVKAQVTGKQNLRYGTFIVNDREGVNVAREIQEHFEDNRNTFLHGLDQPAPAAQFVGALI